MAAQRVDVGLLRRGGHPAPEVDSLVRESSEWKARSTPTLLVAKPPCLCPPKSHMGMNPPAGHRAEGPPPHHPATQGSRSCARDMPAAGQGTAVATHQELQHFLGVRVDFNDLLVKGRDLGTEGREKV